MAFVILFIIISIITGFYLPIFCQQDIQSLKGLLMGRLLG